jgi:hypothetical protein
MGPARRPDGRPAGWGDDTGGVWIVTTWVLGGVVYVGVLLAWHAGFTAALPFVVVPPLLAVLIGAGNLVGGRRPHRPPPRFNRPDPVPLDPLRADAVPAAPDRPPSAGPGTGP